MSFPNKRLKQSKLVFYAKKTERLLCST